MHVILDHYFLALRRVLPREFLLQQMHRRRVAGQESVENQVQPNKVNLVLSQVFHPQGGAAGNGIFETNQHLINPLGSLSDPGLVLRRKG